MGLGSLYLCACVAVTYYFERYRGAASGIAAAGNGLGYIVVPIIISSLTSYYDTNVGWRNGVLIFGIILSIVTFLCGLTLRPIEIEASTEEEIQEKEMTECLTSRPEPMLTTHLETIHETGIFEVDKKYRQDIEDFSKGAQLDTSTELFSSVPWISGGLMEGKELSKHNASWENIKRGDPEVRDTFCEPGGSKGKHTDHISTHKSNPDISKFPRLKPSYVHAKVIRRTRQRRPSIARPMDRPDSLFTSSLHILPDLERSTSSLQLSNCKHLQLKEKQTSCGEDAAYLSTVSLPGSIDNEIKLDKPPKSSKSFTQRVVDLFDLTLFCNDRTEQNDQKYRYSDRRKKQ
ncbi:unnamed protein product [Hymenolepis diminuta]|uniref:MFS domain-containing protein n=1 Tax=Hymenolepis diminuta TaxID=6216 RepID=A0A0R3SZH1_HYMDI|nr:unnamed protein product [Hymenolepis diminuta]